LSKLLAFDTRPFILLVAGLIPAVFFALDLPPGIALLVPLIALSVLLAVYRRRRPRRVVPQTRDALAFYDDLTGLPNRRFFFEELHACLNTPISKGHFTAVFFLDLDKFKGINDALGHMAGDRFLIEISSRIKNCVPADALFARFAGDEFTLLVPSVRTRDEVVAIAQRIMTQFETEVIISGHRLWANTSIGIAMVGSPRPSASDLLSMADAALYHAKAQGRGKFIIFEPTLPIPSAKSMSLDADIRTAVDRGELVLHYQPIFSMENLEIVGLEALIRWEHPHLGLLRPDAFIHLAEETGVIKTIGEWVIDTATERLSAWQSLYGEDLTMSVNLSALQFKQRDILSHIAGATQRAGLRAGTLQLEITETVLIDDQDQTASMLEELRSLGFAIVIDDFGVGYSSLSYLRRFEIDALKLDRSFLTGIADKRGDALNRGAIQLAHSLEAVVVAEGIERPEHIEFLREASCDFGQGYLLGRPMTERQLMEQVTHHGLSWVQDIKAEKAARAA
jgi:diguanylate cyclase (GGDEF)-like protein